MVGRSGMVSSVMIGRSGNAESIQKRHFFGLPLAAGSCCELDTSSLGQGVALAVSQVALAAPLPSATDNIQLFCNGVFLCALTHDAHTRRATGPLVNRTDNDTL